MNGALGSAALATLVLCACRAGGGAGPTDAPLPELERADGRVVVCIVDARTGRPIAGASLAAVPERHTPEPFLWWEASASESDGDGIARLDLTGLDRDPWLLVAAEGYAPRMELTRHLPPRVALDRAVDLELEVRDLFERPVAGAAVSWYAGCGHTPDLAWAETDAAGRARLAGIAADPSAGDLWVAGPTLATDHGYAPAIGPALVRVGPGVAARGRVVDADGQPLAGVFVGVPVGHHGPWTRSDRDGAFALPGIDAPVEVQVLRESDPRAGLGAFEVPNDGRAMVLTIAPEELAPTTSVELKLRSREGLEPLAGLKIELVRLADGLTRRGRSDEEGRLALDLPHGAWQRRVGGGLSGWQAAQRRFTLGAEPFAETIALDAQARWRFRLVEPHPDARVELVGELERRVLRPEALDAVPVPREGRCAVRVELHDRVRVVPLDSVARRAGGELALELPAPLALRARLIDAAGAPVQGVLWVGTDAPPAWPDGLEQTSESPSTTTWHADADLWVLPAEPRFEARRLARALPWDATELDLGDIVLEPAGARRVMLRDADGAPLVAAEVVHFARLGRHELRPGADGSFETPAFPAESGDALAVLPADGGPTFHATLAGTGPWTVARPDTRAALTVTGADGAPLPRFTVVVAGELFSGANGRVELTGLDPGRHVAFVAADGHTAWRQPLDLEPGAQVDVSVVLQAR